MANVVSDVFGTSNKFRATAPVNKFQATSPVAQAAIHAGNDQAVGGAGPATGTITQQNALNEQLMAAARGEGPSVAQEQLKQTTSENVNRAAGTVASTRGLNPAMAARLALDAGANVNQTAAGQSATLRAGEIMGARSLLGENLTRTGGLQLGQQEAGMGLLRTAGGLDLGAQGLNLQVAAQNAALEQGAQQINAGVSAQNAQTAGNIFGGFMNGAGAAIGFDEGGEVPGYAFGTIDSSGPLHTALDDIHGFSDTVESAPKTGFEGAESETDRMSGSNVMSPDGQQGALMKSQNGSGKKSGTPGQLLNMSAHDTVDAFQRAMSRPVSGAAFARGGAVPAMVSPGEKILPPGTSPADAASKVSRATRVPGKARIAGNSPQNDIVSARLTPGSIVLPRTVVNSSNPARSAFSFVESVLRRGKGSKYAVGGKVAPGPDAAYDPGELDLSAGGFVPDHAHDVRPSAMTEDAGGPHGSRHKVNRTARGQKRTGKMSVSGKPKFAEIR